MEQVNLDDFDREVICSYRDETFRVRDNGAVLRCRRGTGRKRPLDEKWRFGNKNADGYLFFSSQRVHQIVATAFHGPKPSEDYVVDHIDTNRCNNRPENLRWVTRLENLLLNPITLRRILFHYGSIEEFIESPAKPKSGELQQDFEWMRTVTREEAEESYKRLLDWATSEGMSSGGSLGEWVFESRNKQSTAKPSDPGKNQAFSEHMSEAEIKEKVSVNLDRPPICLTIISRGCAQHVDYCPLEMRNYEGKPYANFIDDCLYSPCCTSSEDGDVYCIGGRSIKSQDEYEQWKARFEGRIDDLDDAAEEITREVDPAETLIEHKAARAVIRHMNAAALEDLCATDNSYNYRGSKDEYWPPINYPTLIKIALTGLAYDSGRDAKNLDLSAMTGASYPDLERARTFLAKDERFRVGLHPETGEFAKLDVENALKANFIEVAEILERRFDVVKALAELLSQKGRLTENEVIEFLYKPENMKSMFNKHD